MQGTAAGNGGAAAAPPRRAGARATHLKQSSEWNLERGAARIVEEAQKCVTARQSHSKPLSSRGIRCHSWVTRASLVSYSLL